MAYSPTAPSLYGKGLYGRGLYSASHAAIDFDAATDIVFDQYGGLIVAGIRAFAADVLVEFDAIGSLKLTLSYFSGDCTIDFGSSATPYLGPYWSNATNPGIGWSGDVNENGDWVIDNNFPVGWVGNVQTDDIRHAGKKCCWSRANG